MHARNLLLIALTVFQAIIPVFIRKVVAKKKIWKGEEHLTSSSTVDNWKSRREESNSSSKRSTKNKSAKQKKQASNTLDEDQLEELTSWILWRHKASEIEEIDPSIILESPQVKSTKDKELFTKYLLRESQKKTFNCWLLDSAANFQRL